MSCTYDKQDYYVIDTGPHTAALIKALLECNMPRLTFLKLIIMRSLAVRVTGRKGHRRRWVHDMGIHFKYVKALSYALERQGIDRADSEFQEISLVIEELAVALRSRLRIVDIDTLSVDDMSVVFKPKRGLIYLIRGNYGYR